MFRCNIMTYNDFKIEYTDIFKKMMSYSPEQIGSGIYAEKMADLEEQYPEFAEQAENEY